MKRAQAFEIGACSFQLDVFANDFFYPNNGENLVYGLFGNHRVKLMK